MQASDHEEEHDQLTTLPADVEAAMEQQSLSEVANILKERGFVFAAVTVRKAAATLVTIRAALTAERTRREEAEWVVEVEKRHLGKARDLDAAINLWQRVKGAGK